MDIENRKTGLRVFTPEAEGPVVEKATGGAGGDSADASVGDEGSAKEQPKYLARWTRLETEPIFEETRRLEPNETATDQILVEIPGVGLHAVRLELWVASPRNRLLLRFGLKSWRVTAVVRVGTRVDNDDVPAEKAGADPQGS